MYTFGDIQGNYQIIKNLKSIIFNDKISHAYIIYGPKGSGKKLIGNTFAKTIQCENVALANSEKDVSPCGHCNSCRTFDSGNHTDIIYVNPTKNDKLSVGDMREQLVSEVEIKPYKYKRKVFIINMAETMNTSAQNAILKTIEEPPEYAVFIFLASNINDFLPTILSRCIMFKIEPLKTALVFDYIKNKFDIPEEEVYMYSSYAQGNIGAAIEMITSEEFVELRNVVIDFIESFVDKDIIGLFQQVLVFEKYKSNIKTILDILYLCYRDMIVFKCFDYDTNFIIQRDKNAVLKKVSEKLSKEQLFNGAEAICSAKININQNANFQMTIENLFFKLKEKK